MGAKVSSSDRQGVPPLAADGRSNISPSPVFSTKTQPMPQNGRWLSELLIDWSGPRRLNVLEVGHGAGVGTAELLQGLPVHSVLVTVDDHFGGASPADFGRTLDRLAPPGGVYGSRCLPVFRDPVEAFSKIPVPPWFDCVVWRRESEDEAAAFWGGAGLALCAARCLVAFAPAAPGMSEGARGAGLSPFTGVGGGGTWAFYERGGDG